MALSTDDAQRISTEFKVDPEVVHKAPKTVVHEEYLIERHGTCELDPLPSADPNDPLNLPSWRKHVHLILMAFHGLFCTSNAGSVVTACVEWAELYNVSVSTSTYIATSQLIALAIAPLFWIPIVNRWGRLPIFMVSALGSSMFNIACAQSGSYASHLVYRVLVGFFISPGITVPQGVVVEMFFAKQRAQKMGIWVLFANSGASVGPALMGFLIKSQGWRWVYRVFAILEFVLFVLYYLLSPETLYRPDINGREHNEDENRSSAPRRNWWLRFARRIDPAPLRMFDFIEPLWLLRHWNILVVNIAYSVAHNFVLTLLLVEMSTLYEPLFNLDPQQAGLNYFALLAGSLLGEQLGGPFSDWLRNRQIRRTKRNVPEDRLWISHLGIQLIIIGIIVFFVEIANASGHWNIKPDIGVGIAAFGVQIVATVLVTYCSDSLPRHESASLGVVINFTKLVWGFASPFWYPVMVESVGLRGSAGVVTGVTVAFAMLPLVALQIWGRQKKH
ncbi:hypothetical protein CLAIMM_00144 [Cladophialophora immunda]|nr:hypothetical protein CLAIMM_00144 [Cladophialophora immunda]